MHTTIVLFAVFAATVANTAVFATLGLCGRSVGLSELSSWRRWSGSVCRYP